MVSTALAVDSVTFAVGNRVRQTIETFRDEPRPKEAVSMTDRRGVYCSKYPVASSGFCSSA
jgi:hypothetical protein